MVGFTWKLEVGWHLSQQANSNTDEETEVERGRICPVLQLSHVAGLGRELGVAGSLPGTPSFGSYRVWYFGARRST